MERYRAACIIYYGSAARILGNNGNLRGKYKNGRGGGEGLFVDTREALLRFDFFKARGCSRFSSRASRNIYIYEFITRI